MRHKLLSTRLDSKSPLPPLQMVRLLGAVMRSIHMPPDLNVEDPSEDHHDDTVGPAPPEEEDASTETWSNGGVAGTGVPAEIHTSTYTSFMVWCINTTARLGISKGV